ncbi:MAG: F0F1 ATP synthase subunit gamma [Actinomycetota bacterium]
MAQQLRAIKRRIGSVKSTQKITSAMELIASSRVVKAQQRVEAARPYAEEMRRLMTSVAGKAGRIDHPLLSEREEGDTVATIVVTSDRGLAGAYNSNVLRFAERDMEAHGRNHRLYLVGKKAITYFRFRGYEFENDNTWQGISDRPGIEDGRLVARAVTKAFADGDADQVRLIYTKYQSALIQRPTVVQLLPLPEEELEEMADASKAGGPSPSYVFEPDPEDILGLLVPRYVEGNILQALLESAASEHAARRRAMKAATDNASELIDDLTRVYNQARQAEITTEIMEVIGGAEALSSAGRD